MSGAVSCGAGSASHLRGRAWPGAGSAVKTSDTGRLPLHSNGAAPEVKDNESDCGNVE